MQTAKGVKKLRANMIKKYGSEEAWKQVMRERGSMGGKHPNSGLKKGTEQAMRVSQLGREAWQRKKNG